MASFIAVHILSSCGTQNLEHAGSVAATRKAYLLRGMWDLSSPTRDQTPVLCIVRWILNHWATREVPWDLCRFKGKREVNTKWPCLDRREGAEHFSQEPLVGRAKRSSTALPTSFNLFKIIPAFPMPSAPSRSEETSNSYLKNATWF